MKSLKEFIQSQKSDSEQEVPNITVEEQVELEATDLPPFVYESNNNNANSMDPPALLVMRRKTVRTFPDGQRVALYYVDKINKYVTVPYIASKWKQGAGILTPESHDNNGDVIEENIIHHLNDIVKNGRKSIKFKDGSSTKVDTLTANAMLKVHGALNDENKAKYADMAHKSRHHFGKVVDFTWKHIK